MKIKNIMEDKIIYSGHPSFEEVIFIGEKTCKYKLKYDELSNKGYYWANRTFTEKNKMIFKWLGIEDIIPGVVKKMFDLDYSFGTWPEVPTKEQAIQLMNSVLAWVDYYNKYGGKEHLRRHLDRLYHLDIIAPVPDNKIEHSPVTASNKPKNYTRPTDREIKLTINKCKSYKVKSR